MLFQGKRKGTAHHLWKASQEDKEEYEKKEKKLATKLSGKKELPKGSKESLKLRMQARKQLFAELPEHEQRHWRAKASKGTETTSR